jgi:hypothetical protein
MEYHTVPIQEACEDIHDPGTKESVTITKLQDSLSHHH